MGTLVIDALSGCSGDMFVSALSQLAQNQDEIMQLPQRLGFKNVEVTFTDVVRSSIACKKCDFYVVEEHTHGHGHGHEHSHTHADHHHDHHHRHLSDIQAIISAAELSDGCKQRALDIFQKLGEVEAAAHGIPLEKVHFHEVGAIDSIMDIVASAYCLDQLQIDQAFCSTICVGSGQVKTAHGILPVPAPATERLLQGLTYSTGELPGEWCTPTGAAIIAHLQVNQTVPALSINASAYGAGGKDPAERPNALRLRLAEDEKNDEVIQVIHCNIDDMPGELLGADFIQGILDAGALDATIRPIIMKKGRPGYLIEVLCHTNQKQTLAEYLCQETSTIGVRMFPAERYILERKQISIKTKLGDVLAKEVTLPDGSKRCMPEYEDCARLAQQYALSTLQVYQTALNATAASLSGRQQI